MPPPVTSPAPTRSRRSVRALTAAVLSAAVLAGATLTAPAALARPLEPGPAVPGPSARPAVAPGAAPAGDLGSLRARATRLRAKLDDQHRRLEVLAEDLEEAYARGVGLLADASELDRRRQAAEREVAVAQAELDERARSSYMAGPGWFVANLVGADDPADALARLPLQRAVLDADLALVDLREGEVSPPHDRHGANPFAGRRLRGRVVLTLLRGCTVFADGRVAPEACGRLIKPDRGER